MNLGENIYKNRTVKNWSQSDLAEALDVPRLSVSKWENNSAIPDLDKLMKMKEIFEITLDELVYGKQESIDMPDESKNSLQTPSIIPFRMLTGTLMMVFGMIFLYLSVFWGDHLYLGETFGELFPAIIVLISIALMAPYDFRVFAVSTITYFLYSVVCFGFLKIHNVTNSIFILIASFVVVIWFIVCGTHATRVKR